MEVGPHGTPFAGFPRFRANVTFVPTQFFTQVIPSCARGTVRVVGYTLRKILGWVDRNGNPVRDRLQLSYRELIREAGVSRDSIAAALDEALERKYLICVQEPAADRDGHKGQSGIYGIRWDEDGPYTDDPDAFNGFYYPEAAVVEEVLDGKSVKRPKSARKNIPNDFFDILLPNEPLSVIRVVGALMFYSIQWGKSGERRVDVTKSITELSRLTRLSRHHVHEAVSRARRMGYIVQVSAGRFDPAAGSESESASYAIRWQEDPPLVSDAAPVGKGERDEPHQSEKVHGMAVRKGVRKESEKVNGNESEKVHDKRINKGILKPTTAAAAAASGPFVDQSATPAPQAVSDLKSAGFDGVAARTIAAANPEEVIRRQLAWFPHRGAQRNPLGLLRRAIEQDWAPPKVDLPVAGDDPDAVAFASNYYAGYHGNPGEAETTPLPRDLAAASGFLVRLRKLGLSSDQVASVGRAFGRVVKAQHQKNPGASPFLSATVVAYGDHYIREFGRARAEESRQRDERFSEQMAGEIRAAYTQYLKEREQRLRNERPDLLEMFLREREERKRAATSSKVSFPAEWLRAGDTESARLDDFARHFSRHAEFRVLAFDPWMQQRPHPESILSTSTEVPA